MAWSKPFANEAIISVTLATDIFSSFLCGRLSPGTACQSCRINADVAGQIRFVTLVQELHLVPDLVLGILRRHSSFNEQLVVLDMEILQLHWLLFYCI